MKRHKPEPPKVPSFKWDDRDSGTIYYLPDNAKDPDAYFGVSGWIKGSDHPEKLVTDENVSEWAAKLAKLHAALPAPWVPMKVYLRESDWDDNVFTDIVIGRERKIPGEDTHHPYRYGYGYDDLRYEIHAELSQSRPTFTITVRLVGDKLYEQHCVGNVAALLARMPLGGALGVDPGSNKVEVEYPNVYSSEQHGPPLARLLDVLSIL